MIQNFFRFSSLAGSFFFNFLIRFKISVWIFNASANWTANETFTHFVLSPEFLFKF